LTAKPRSSTFGRPITLTATVKNLSHTGGVPPGSVNFLDAFGNILGLQVRLRDGKAILRTSGLPVGRDTIQVDYIGNLDFAPSSSGIFVTIRPHRSSTKATDSLALPRSNHSSSSTATVSGAGGGIVSLAGTVAFLDGSTARGMALLDQVKAMLTTGPSVVVPRIRPIYAINGGTYSRISVPRKQTVKQSSRATSRPPTHLLSRN
jgi:hypothetical protein